MGDEDELKLAYTPERMAYAKAGRIVAEIFRDYLQTETAGSPSSFMQSVFDNAMIELKRTDKQVQETDHFAIAETKSGSGARSKTFKYILFKYTNAEGKEESYALDIGDGLYSLVLGHYLGAKL